MIDIVKILAAALFGGGVAYGALRTQIQSLKETMKQYNGHSERLATIEAKLDILLNKSFNN
jgi:hypothetical protein